MALEQARREATLDKLTGLSNRRAFEIMSASLFRQHFSIVLIDANSFKAVNDNFGHNAGDATLIRIAAHLRAAFHDAQLLCRLGGDEFLVLSFVGARGLRAQIRRFRQMVMWDPAHESYRKLMFGVSCGLASIPVDAKNVEEAVQIADERMYAVKTRLKQFATRGTASPTTSEKKRDTGAKLRRHSSQSLALKT
jgi:diguanylate cyclase (GGDEF)-like protein